MKTTLQRWGNSQGIRIPKGLMERLGINVGSQVVLELSQDSASLIISPLAHSRPVRGRYRIEDLVASSPPAAFQGEAAWGPAQGNETW